MAREPKDFAVVNAALAELSAAVEALMAADGSDVRAEVALESAQLAKQQSADALIGADVTAETKATALVAALRSVEVGHSDE